MLPTNRLATLAQTLYGPNPIRSRAELGSWYRDSPTGNDNLLYRGEPDRSLLNRLEWYEMLYFINKYANTYHQGSRYAALKAERLLKSVVPGNLRSHDNVTTWLNNNFHLYM